MEGELLGAGREGSDPQNSERGLGGSQAQESWGRKA